MFKVSGYRPLDKEANCDKFSINKFANLTSINNDRYIIPEYTPISSQTNNDCVSNACADSLELLKGIEDPNKVEQVSRRFIYYNARNYIHETNKDAGCMIVDALHSLTTLGACREITWDYSNSVFTKPTLAAYTEANDNKLSTYYQITSTGDDRIKEIETAIKANHPVVFGVKVGQQLLDYKGEEKIFDPPMNDVGGHAMIITGIRTNAQGEKEFYIKNSWSENWGMSEPETSNLGKGHAWFSSNYIEKITKGDIFVPTRMIDFLV